MQIVIPKHNKLDTLVHLVGFTIEIILRRTALWTSNLITSKTNTLYSVFVLLIIRLWIMNTLKYEALPDYTNNSLHSPSSVKLHYHSHNKKLYRLQRYAQSAIPPACDRVMQVKLDGLFVVLAHMHLQSLLPLYKNNCYYWYTRVGMRKLEED